MGRAAVDGLVTFGEAAVPEMNRVLRESDDEDALVKARQVLRRVRREHPARLAA